MNELRLTDTNAGDDSAGRVFGLEGNLYLPLVGGAIVGIDNRPAAVRNPWFLG